MPKAPREVADFTALPVILKSAVLSNSAKHYLYVKAHEPRIPDEDSIRSLFLVNIPVSTTESHLRHLFATQLEAGRVERVDFSEDGSKQSSALIASSKSNKKRKRQTVDEIEVGLDSYHLPSAYPSQIHTSGSTAIVTFVDRPSMEASMKAVRRTAKSNTEIVWGKGIESKLPAMGLSRYEAHKTLQHPSRSDLLSIVDNYMTAYSALESAKSAENARKRAIPDEDGFITVTRGSGNASKKEEAEEARAKQKAKETKLEDFYRFQMREKRKEQQGQMLRQFEQDKKKVEEMRSRRSALKPEG